MRSKTKTKTNRTSYARFFPRFEQATGKYSKFDWFTALFAPVVIGRANYSGIGFSIVIWKLLSLYSPEHLHKDFKVSAGQMIVVWCQRKRNGEVLFIKKDKKLRM